MTPIRLVALALVLGLAACTPSLIPGTPIQDTEDNRAILDVVRRYKLAFEAKDAPAVVALASPRYLDARDSISHATLSKNLSDQFAKITDPHLDLQVRRIEIEKEHATVDYFYSIAFKVDTASADYTRESDEKRMTLERSGKDWLVVSGF